MGAELIELRERLEAEKKKVTDRLNEIDDILSSIDTVVKVLSSESESRDSAQLPLLDIGPKSGRLTGLSFKEAVSSILKEQPSKWWTPKEIFDTLLKEGFETKSKNFNNVARNMLMTMRRKEEVIVTKSGAKRGYMYKYKDPNKNINNGGYDNRKEGVRMIRIRPPIEKEEETSTHE